MKLHIPERFHDAAMNNLDPQRFACVIEFAKNLAGRVKEGKGLLLSGPPGIGKTWAVAALTKRYAYSHGRPDYEFQTAPFLFDALDEFDKNVDEYREQTWKETYSKVPWLVVNDLGKEYRAGKLGEQVTFKLGKLLRVRSERKLVTHITTNFDGKRLKEEYGDSIVSLLSEMTTTHVVLGPDLRISRR
jgi:DNA replication protein DnaC